MEIEFKCDNHNIIIEKLQELPNDIYYGDTRQLVSINGQVLKTQRYTCPICHKKLWEEMTYISQKEYAKLKK